MAQNSSNKSDNVKIALYLFGGYLLWRVAKNFIGKGDTGTSVEALGCDTIWNSGQLSRNKSAYYADADEIYTAIQGTGLFVNWYEDDDKIASVLMRAGNQKDVDALICAWGYRKKSALSPGEPLTAWITSYLDADKVQQVNDYYAYKGISTRW
jgi:hypothetical protein